MAGARSSFLLGAALLLSGAAFDSLLLLVPGVALAGLPAAVAAWVRLAAWGAELEAAPPPARVVEGEPFPLRYRLRVGLLPAAAKLEDELAAGEGRLGLRAPWRAGPVELCGSVARRGRHLAAPARLRFADPLGLVERTVASSGSREVLVLPRIEPLVGPEGRSGPSAGELRGEISSAGSARRRRSAIEPELEGLGPYRPGSPASRIYWPALARGGDLVERRLGSESGSAPLVALDAGADSVDAVDRAARAAASLTRHLAATAGCELLLPGSARSLQVDRALHGWEQAHAQLALVECGGRIDPRLLDRDGAVFLVCAGRIGEAGASIGRGFAVGASPLAGRAPDFTVAGCYGYAAGRAPRRRADQAGRAA